MKKLPTLLLGLSFLTPCIAQYVNIRPETEKIADEIRKSVRLDGAAVGMGSDETDKYRTFIKLQNQANVEELVQFTYDTSAVLKGYAAWALIDKGYQKIDEIFSRFMQTGEQVWTLFGCIGSLDGLDVVMYYQVGTSGDSTLTRLQYLLLDSLILYAEKADERLIYYALEHNFNPERDYARIRELAFEEKKPGALEALARYQNPADIQGILKQDIIYAYKAIALFPHPDFWPFLEKSKDYNHLSFFSAVAAYKSRQSADLLNEIYSKCSQENHTDAIRRLIQAASNYNCPFYIKLLRKGWVEKGINEYSTVIYLTDTLGKNFCPDITTGILKYTEYPFADWDFYTNFMPDKPEKVFPVMLAHLDGHCPEMLDTVLTHLVENLQYLMLEPVTAYLTKKPRRAIVPTLLERLQREDRVDDMFCLTEALLVFEDSQIRKRTVEILNNNRRWTAMDKKFRELAKEKGVRLDD